MKFNPEKHYLGPLCNCGRDYLGEGLSLRYKINNTCVLCSLEYSKKWRGKNMDKVKSYYINNKGKYIERGKIYRSENKNKVSEWFKKNRSKVNSLGKKYDEACRKELKTKYIKQTIHQTTKIPLIKITPEMIELKREQLIMFRKIQEIKNGFTGTGNQRTETNECTTYGRNNQASRSKCQDCNI